MKLVVSGGAPIAKHTEEFLRVCFCCPAVQGYGLTETCAASMIAVPDTIVSVLYHWSDGNRMICLPVRTVGVLDIGGWGGGGCSSLGFPMVNMFEEYCSIGSHLSF